METRLIIAYSIMLGMALVVAGIVFYLWYNARDRALARRRMRESRRYDQRMSAAAKTEDV